MQIFSNDVKGLNLTIVETIAATGEVIPSSGPFSVEVTDTAGVITFTPGSPDNVTASKFVSNGSGKTGTVSVKVTDQSNGLSGQGSFDVLAPAPPPTPKADTLTVDFAPAS